MQLSFTILFGVELALRLGTGGVRQLWSGDWMLLAGFVFCAQGQGMWNLGPFYIFAPDSNDEKRRFRSSRFRIER